LRFLLKGRLWTSTKYFFETQSIAPAKYLIQQSLLKMTGMLTNLMGPQKVVQDGMLSDPYQRALAITHQLHNLRGYGGIKAVISDVQFLYGDQSHVLVLLLLVIA
jgi:hypothetical protein